MNRKSWLYELRVAAADWDVADISWNGDGVHHLCIFVLLVDVQLLCESEIRNKNWRSAREVLKVEMWSSKLKYFFIYTLHIFSFLDDVMNDVQLAYSEWTLINCTRLITKCNWKKEKRGEYSWVYEKWKNAYILFGSTTIRQRRWINIQMKRE